MSMRLLTGFFVAALLASVSFVSTASAEDCLMPDTNPFAQTNSTFGWFFDYENSIIFSESLRYTNVPPFDAQWKKLEQIEKNDPVVVVREKQNDNGTWFTECVKIEEPVLVTTWAAPLLASDGYEQRLSELDGNHELLAYITANNQLNTHGDNQNQTIWFAKHGQTTEFLDEFYQRQNFDMTRECLNMSEMKSYYENLEACQQSILWGLPTVGVPYGFGWTSDAYGPNGLPWWNTSLYVGVVDRRALTRPSYNATIISQLEAEENNQFLPSNRKIATNDGVPSWDASSQSYALPMGDVLNGNSSTDAYTRGVWEALCPGYDCEGKFGFLAWDGSRSPYDPLNAAREVFAVEGTSLDDYYDEFGDPIELIDIPIEVFNKWLTAYQHDNWVSDTPPWSSGAGFPFASIGLTVNWIQTSVNEPLALSEFILKGRAPITWIAKRSGSQYLGERQPGQVSWCDSCLGDLDMSGSVDVGDLLMLLQAYGHPQPCMTFDDTPYFVFTDEQPSMKDVGVAQILALIDHWGECNGWPPLLEHLRPADCQ